LISIENRGKSGAPFWYNPNIWSLGYIQCSAQGAAILGHPLKSFFFLSEGFFELVRGIKEVTCITTRLLLL
jgi:hypothetical protein